MKNKRLVGFIISFCALLCAITVFPIHCKGAEIPQDTYLSDETVTICEIAQEKYHIAAPLLEALIETESSGRQYAKSSSSVGLCQLNVKYQRDLALETMGLSEVDLFDMETNIFTACAYLLQLIEELDADGEPYQVLRAYNMGPENSKVTYANVIDYGKYANTVMDRAHEITLAQDLKRMEGEGEW